MAEHHLHLLLIKIRPQAYIKEVISGCWRNVQEAIANKGTIVYGFKVVGENRLVFVLDGGIDAALDAMNAAFGEQIESVCTPLRSYETFAEHVLGLEKSLVSPAATKLGSDGQIFWLQLDIDYKDMKIADLLSVWRAEAMTILSLRANGSARLEIELYKVVGQRQVHVFMKIQNGDLIDDILFTLPLFKENGNQVQVVSKSVVKL